MATILLIEDDRELATTLSESLTLAGHRDIGSLDGLSACGVLETDEPIDLLLADLVMPVGHPHGLALARMARHRRPDVAVIFMTGYAEFVEEVAGERILIKPVRATAVLEAIAASLRDGAA